MDGRNIALIIENHLPGAFETVLRLIAMTSVRVETEQSTTESGLVLFTGDCEPSQRPGHRLTQLASFSIQPCHGVDLSARLIYESPTVLYFVADIN